MADPKKNSTPPSSGDDASIPDELGEQQPPARIARRLGDSLSSRTPPDAEQPEITTQPRNRLGARLKKPSGEIPPSGSDTQEPNAQRPAAEAAEDISVSKPPRPEAASPDSVKRETSGSAQDSPAAPNPSADEPTSAPDANPANPEQPDGAPGRPRFSGTTLAIGCIAAAIGALALLNKGRNR